MVRIEKRGCVYCPRKLHSPARLWPVKAFLEVQVSMAWTSPFLAVIVVVSAAVAASMPSQCKPNELLCVNSAGTAGLCYIPQDRWDCCDGFLHYMGPGAMDECCYNPATKKTYLANFTTGGCLEFKRTPEPKPVVVPTTTATTTSSLYAGLSLTNWILIGSGVVVLIGAAVFYVVQRKRASHAPGNEICIMETKDQTKPKEIMLFD
ncbi:hypothetical protein DYB32_006304 [Aphanomyces invadans]|uniref:Uncharacterized protein n=1 Tax=Aphanomyces invadans TaxID=157072 RepID=A0A418ARW0_9STRA|nr:hypothetical protein DYB32_006304 [Aphanomyces invadans]